MTKSKDSQLLPFRRGTHTREIQKMDSSMDGGSTPSPMELSTREISTAGRCGANAKSNILRAARSKATKERFLRESSLVSALSSTLTE